MKICQSDYMMHTCKSKTKGLKEIPEDISKRRARTRWRLAYMLHYNPNLRVLRKQYLEDVHKRLETEAALRKEEKLRKKQKKGNIIEPVVEPTSNGIPEKVSSMFNVLTNVCCFFNFTFRQAHIVGFNSCR